MAVKECCQQPNNLQVQPSDRPDLTIRQCGVCGCRHFELSVDPGVIGLKGTSL